MSSLPSCNARSISAASLVASADTAPLAFSEGRSMGFAALPAMAFSAGLAAAGLCAAFGASFGGSFGVLGAALAAALRADIDVIPFVHDLVAAQLHLAVGDAFPSLHVVFHAVPGADEVHLGFGEIEAARGLVGHDAFFDLGDSEALAGRSPLVQAEVRIGVVFTLLLEHADLVLAHEHDPAIAVFHLRRLCHELLGHAANNLL